MARTPFEPDAFVDAWNSHDADRVAGLYADDATVLRPQFPDPIRGREQIVWRVGNLLRAIPDLRMEEEDVVVEEDHVALLVRFTGTNTGEFALTEDVRVPATGGRVDYEIAAFLTIGEDGKIRHDRGVVDTARLARQLGIAPDVLDRLIGTGGEQRRTTAAR